MSDNPAAVWAKAQVEHVETLAEHAARESAVAALVEAVIAGTLADPLELALAEVFGRFGFHATHEALAVALERHTVAEGRAISSTKAKIEAALVAADLKRKRGRPGGWAAGHPDKAGARTRLALLEPAADEAAKRQRARKRSKAREVIANARGVDWSETPE